MKALLVDDHALFREALVMLMRERLPALAWLEAGSLAEAREHLRRDGGSLELALVDLGLPDSDGLSTLHAVQAEWPGLRVVVISADARTDTVLAAIDAGAVGFVPKRADALQMESALRCVLAGGVYVPALGATDDSNGAADGEASAEAPPLLSPRQLEVLRLLIEGHSNKAIMRELAMSESTVKTHLRAIFRKLDVGNRTQAALACERLGLNLRPQ